MRVWQPYGGPTGPGHAPAADLDHHTPAGRNTVTVAEPDPLIVVGCHPQICTEGRHPDGEHDDTAGLGPGLQPAHRATGQPADALADQDDIEPVDHRRQHVDPRWITGDDHQPLERHPHVGRGADAKLRKAGDTDPGTLARWHRSERQSQRHRCLAATGDR
jgi:hypothetical protein